MNGIISNVNNVTIEELNLAHGLILYKGHVKDKSSDRAYRTISFCPFLAKAELYIADITGTALTFIDSRLATAYEWNGEVMGPYKDDNGFEQALVSSGKV